MATHPRRMVALIAGAMVVLAGCSSTASSSPTATTASSGSVAPSAEASGPKIGDVQLPEPELKNIRLGNSGNPSANVMHIIWAECNNLPAKYGLNIDFLQFDGAGPAAQALLANQVDVSDNSGGPAIASLATDSPMVLAYVTRDNLTDNLYSQPNIKTAEDLRGGSIAISSFGSQSHAGALLSLKVLGLTTDDVTITQVGNDNARLAALQAGSVSASMNDATQANDLTGLGLNILVKLADDVKPGQGGNPRTSLTFLRDFVDKYPNTVLDLVAMYTEANHAWMQDPAKSAQCLADAADMSLDDARADIDAVLTEPWTPLDGKCDPGVMDFAKQVLLAANPDLADVNAADACTNEFVDKLADLGFQKQLGIPGY